jgi:alkyl hydroperoxide reductase subunit AhpF
MVKSTTLLSAFCSLLASTVAVTIPDTDYDVIVVGGGPAGLSALSGVSRVRRTALMIDSGHYRNDPTREMHDVIGNDGKDICPAPSIT